MPRIQPLPPDVVNKIAAGEVIERPASVVKELVENSVDSGATRIEVHLEKGGLDSITVTDNGCGIDSEDLPIAVASHSTSKIRSADDLFSVATLGFRGEALASIAAVSQISLKSRTKEADSASELVISGGQFQEPIPVGGPVGTSIEIRNLFFNTPVRRRFLRSVTTELGHATEVVTKTALAHPRLHVVLRHNQRIVHELPPADSLGQRVADIYGPDLADALIEVESRDEQASIQGLVADPTQSRANGKMQHLFLNGRSIKDRSLQHALGEAYRGLLLTGRYPICFLYLQLPADAVDVNVHPAKHEVRFADGGRIYSQLLGMLRTKFLTTDLKARGRAGENSSGGDAPREVLESSEKASELVAWAKEQLAPQQASMPWESATPSGSPPAGPPPERSQPLTLNRLDAPPTIPLNVPHIPPSEDQCPPPDPAIPDRENLNQKELAATALMARAMQIHNRYLVTETREGVEVIDQHALHERILYEQLKGRIASEALESQRLLVPEPIDLSTDEAEALLAHRSTLARLGVEIEPFGGGTVLLLSYPAMLANLQPGEIVADVVQQLVGTAKEPEARDLLDRLLHSIACKAAVKYGDHLAPEEIDALLSHRHLVQDHHHCPHGRPTSLVFTREDLDRQFQRT